MPLVDPVTTAFLDFKVMESSLGRAVWKVSEGSCGVVVQVAAIGQNEVEDLAPPADGPFHGQIGDRQLTCGKRCSRASPSQAPCRWRWPRLLPTSWVIFGCTPT